MTRSSRARRARRWPRRAASAACSIAIGLLLAGLISAERDSRLVFGTGAASDTSARAADATDDSRLLVDPVLLSKLQTLADGLSKEIVLCLTGTVEDGVGRATDFVMPAIHISTPTSSSVDACPEETIGVWHNHTPLGSALVRMGRSWNGDGNLSRRPEMAAQLCRLSERDIETLAESTYRFAMISVDLDTWCWWSSGQVLQFAVNGEYAGHPIEGQITTGR